MIVPFPVIQAGSGGRGRQSSNLYQECENISQKIHTPSRPLEDSAASQQQSGLTALNRGR
jgi:hypothetical protein